MPSNANRQFLDFEKPIKDLIETIEKYKHDAEKNKMDMSEPIRQLEESILQKRKEITQHLTSWQRVQLSRHPDRPYTMKYIEKMTSCFLELYGDRNVKDDKAMIGGFANLGWRNCNDHWPAKRYQYQDAADAEFRNGKSGRLSQSVAINEAC